ncbi:unnamed protein product [Ambrosiozyma monospora]|uniref:Unnamed protein product n=1 Tax=Ambrosiozyma monospora TaxID=43982 RepID=A0A9W6SZC6_AMBMO|nr:unnamed protein product [Ambrosiozyma monospora]
MQSSDSIGYNDSSAIALSKKPTRTADVKVVLLGESSVGKSSILQRFQSNTFNENKSSTIGAAFISKKIFKTNPSNEDCSLINLQIWDTAGQERFHNLTPLYYRNANLALIVFDLNDESSFKKAEFWTKELNMYKHDNENLKMKILLVDS